MKAFNILIETYDDTTKEKIENIIDEALNHYGIDCSYDISEKATKKDNALEEEQER